MQPISTDDTRWPAMLSRLSSHSPFARPEWTRLLAQLEGFDEASYVLDDGAWILPGVVKKKPLRQQSFLSLPFGTHGGPLGEGQPPQALLDELLAQLVSRVGPWTTITRDPMTNLPLPAGFREKTTQTHLLDLSPGYVRLWEERFSKNLRNQVRKAEKLGVVVQREEGPPFVTPLQGGPGLSDILPDFMRLWDDMQAAKKLRLPFTPAFWQALLSVPWCRVYAARLSGRVLAVAVLLVGKGQAHWWQGVVDRSAGAYNPNRLLVARAIEDLCGEGIAMLDLGGSEGQAGLSQFKASFGAVETPVVHWRHAPGWARWMR